MPDDIHTLPADTDTHFSPPLAPSTTLALAGMPLGLQIFFEPALNAFCKDAARYMSGAAGFVPPHLLGKPQACFAVVSRSLTWRLDPFAVAQSTFTTPDGKVGYMGTLCQAIIVQSGRLDGGIKFRHEGDWERLRGKFKITVSPKGGKYPVPTWEEFGPEEEGLFVIVSAKLKDEDNPREMPFYLKQAYPRFSTLWAVDPATQIQYTAVRRFGTSVVPELFMGVPFDRDEAEGWASTLRDVTPPRPQLEDVTEQPRRRSRARPAEPEPAETTETTAEQQQSLPAKFFFSDSDGVVHEFVEWEQAVAAYAEMLEGARNEVELAAAWENGAQLIHALRESDHDHPADMLGKQYSEMMAALQPAPSQAQSAPAEKTKDDEYDVLVPYDGGSIQQWYYVAREKLKQMLEVDHRPPADFTRYRRVNVAALQKLDEEYNSWRKILERMLTQGERAAD